MKIYFSYMAEDKHAAERIIKRLRVDGHEFVDHAFKQQPGVPTKSMVDERDSAEAAIVIISENTRKSRSAQYHLSAIALGNIFHKKKKKIVIAKIDKVESPGYMSRFLEVDLSSNFEAGLDVIANAFAKNIVPLAAKLTIAVESSTKLADTKSQQLENLRSALRRGRLTLVCGAGVSVEAGIPAWGDLLIKLLEAMLERISKTHSLQLDKEAAGEFHQRYGASSLILGKYLKNNLGREFSSQMRDALYAKDVVESSLIKSIVELSRPQRDGRPLDSIITFNFDNLIEENLKASGIAFKSIFSESIHHGEKQIPIYHVHGFLPRIGKIPAEADLVFSEDAYHSQFIDPFSWSNLIQLNKLTQSTCLFVGISLTDPNMRRLLDVAWRKNPDKTLSHYIIRKRPRVSEGDILDEVSKILEEQDANALGLNVVWIDQFDEIPKILSDISAAEEV